MKMKKNTIISSLINILLFAGCLYFSYLYLDSYIRSAYTYDSLLAISNSITEQEFLLKTILQGASKEKVLAMTKEVVGQLEDGEAKLIVSSDSITFGETKILFEHEKVVGVE
jgi:hypothetical protein